MENGLVKFREAATSLSASNGYEEKLPVKYMHFDSDYDVTYLIPLFGALIARRMLMTGEARNKIDLDDFEIPFRGVD